MDIFKKYAEAIAPTFLHFKETSKTQKMVMPFMADVAHVYFACGYFYSKQNTMFISYNHFLKNTWLLII